jgi:hypothetical protein
MEYIMGKIGKIKFSIGKLKIDYMRVCSDVKDPKGVWKIVRGFPEQMFDLPFYFPFRKLENNISIRYTGYTKLPMNGKRGGAQGSYFVQSMGIGHPIYARPDGHNGIIYDGRKSDKLLLTQERLDSWSMVKRRISVIVVPQGHAPSDYLVWHTTSDGALSELLKEYSALQILTGSEDISLLPLHLKVKDKSYKNSSNQPVKYSYGSIEWLGDIFDLPEQLEKVSKLRSVLGVETLEAEWEKHDIFFADDEEVSDIPEGYVSEVDEDSGEVIYRNSESGEEFVPAVPTASIDEYLQGFVPKDQAKEIASLAKKLGKEKDALQVTTPAQGLMCLNRLRTLDLKSA